MPSCLLSAPRGTAFGCRASPTRCLLFATRSRPAAATVIRKTVGGAEGRRPHTACEFAFWTGWQTSPEDQQEAPRLLAGFFGRKKAAASEQPSSPGATDAWLGVLALATFALFALFMYRFLQPQRNLPNLLVAGYILRTWIWSPTAVTRTAIALKAPLPLVRLFTTVRALDLDAVAGNDAPHTALTTACKTGNTGRIRGLLSLGASPDVAPAGKPRPLVIACSEGNTEAAEELLRAGANPNFLPGDRTSPLAVACCEGHAGVVRALANAGAPVNGPIISAKAGVRKSSPLGLAIACGHAQVVEALLQSGASPTAMGNMGMTPIGVACAADDIPGPVRAAIVHLLLQAGADPRVIDGSSLGGSPRTGSARAEYWYSSSVGGSRGGRKAGRPSAIDIAALYGAAEVIPVLVAAGEDPGRAPADVSYKELQAGVPMPPLFAAAMAGHVGVVQALVAAGADVEAAVGGREAKGKLSRGLEGGAGGGGGGCGGVTALCLAVQEGHVDAVRVLVAAGANTQVLCEDGRTLLQVAREQAMVEMEEVLLAAEAACN